MRWMSGWALAALLVLGGCASMRLIESDVSSHSQWPTDQRPGSFRFERLPSQQAQAAQQEAIEAAALPALQKAGFTLAAADASPQYVIQVASRLTRFERAPWDDPWPWGWNTGFFYGGRAYRGASVGLSFYAPQPYYVQDVSVLIRDARTQQVLYETSARHDGRWADEAVRGTLFEAAMRDFPQPAISPRRVRIEIPR
ncbi:MAG: DUF4136 domain-containing protein [Caldimonas manganoxidans]|nr:DUF4136 domain-containing protein [Caldimonas manganoxidans]